MKLFISLSILCSSSLMLSAQEGGGGRVPAGQQAAESAPVQSSPVQGTPAQTSRVQSSPVQTSPLQTTPRLTQPGLGGTLDSSVQQQRSFSSGPGGAPGFSTRTEGDLQTGAPGFSTPAQAVDPVGARPAQSGETPSGVNRLDSVVPPMQPPVIAPMSVPPPIRNSFGAQPLNQELADPAGAALPGSQEAFGTGDVVGGTIPADPQLDRFEDEAFAQQFQSSTVQSGTVQMAFPRENAVVTIVSQNGNLILQGTVSDEQQRQNIERTIRQMSSAGFIDNQLQVAPRFNQSGEERPFSVVR